MSILKQVDSICYGITSMVIKNELEKWSKIRFPALTCSLWSIIFLGFFSFFFFKYYLRGLKIGFKDKRHKTCLHGDTQESKFKLSFKMD